MPNLTDAIVKALQPEAKDRITYEPGGLGVRVSPSGRKLFVVQARVAGQSRRFPIGPVTAELNVRTARDRAEVIKAELAQGLDPAAEQRKREDAKRHAREQAVAAEQAERQRRVAAGVTLSDFWTAYEARVPDPEAAERTKWRDEALRVLKMQWRRERQKPN